MGKIYRFDARLTEEQKAILQRAADLEGRTMTEFILQAARRTIEERAVMALTLRESETFVDAILRPSEPGPVLRSAVRAYRAATLARKR